MKSVRTIAVPIFTNHTYRREWEFRLTEAIDKNIEARTPFKLVPQGQADTVLTGDIERIDEVVLTRIYGTNLPQESQLVVVVNFTWKDLRTGRILVERKEFNRSATEIPQLNERVYNSEQLAVEECAAAIIDQLQTDWQRPFPAARAPMPRCHTPQWSC
jgi:hypothetical protein